jgi:hypothetical protein
MSGDILMVGGREHLSWILRWLQLAVLIPMALAGRHWGAEGVAVAVTLAASVSLPVVMHFSSKSLDVRPRHLLAVLWRPLLAGALMVIIVRSLHSNSISLPAVRLLVDVATGVLSYVVAVTLFWILSGRPIGVELAIMNLFRAQFNLQRRST